MTFLDNADWEDLVDFEQYFVGNTLKNVSKCIHGEGAEPSRRPAGAGGVDG